MKKLIVMLAIILSVGAIVAGKIHWDNKIEATSTSSEESPKVKSEKESKKNTKGKISTEEIVSYTKNLPEEIVNKIDTALKTAEPMNLVIVGSASTPESPEGWPTLVKQELENTYGNAIFNVIIKEYANQTSNDFVANGSVQEIIALNPDVLLFEPFILADNGNVRLSTRLENIESILNTLYAEFPELTVLLQPANPLLKATYYPNEVTKLQEFAEEKGYIYLNHWTAWPDHQTDEIGPYLSNNLPSETGHQIWADYLTQYFISK